MNGESAPAAHEQDVVDGRHELDPLGPWQVPLTAHACVLSPAMKKKRQSMFRCAVATYFDLARLRSFVV